MDPAVLACAALLAALAAIAFALVTAAGFLLGDLGARRRVFARDVANDPAERLWRRLHRLGRRRALLGSSILVFIFAGAALTLAEPAVPDWLNRPAFAYGVLATLLLAALATLGCAIALTFARSRLRLRIDASLAIAQGLRRLADHRNRVFHDVPTAFGTIDHVIAGLQGVYAVCVVARRPRGSAQLELDGEHLVFDGRGGVSLGNARQITDRFAREGSKLLGHDLQVRLIIAVPGWEIVEQKDAGLLVVNERTLPMLGGWKDERDYLLDEDVAALQRYLDERCVRGG